jgi:hypothetical protein
MNTSIVVVDYKQFEKDYVNYNRIQVKIIITF